jgi:hypothetical protein
LDANTVEQACRLIEEVDIYRPLVMRAPLVKEPITTPSGKVVGERFVPNPAEKMLRRAETALRGVLTDLAFTPTARSRLGLAQVKAQTKLEGLLQARTSRVAPKVVDSTPVYADEG